MLAGVTLADPARLDVRGTVSVGRDVYYRCVNVVLVGDVSWATAFESAQLLSARLRDRGRYRAVSELRDGSSCDRHGLLESVRLPACGPGTILHRDVHIGNFLSR